MKKKICEYGNIKKLSSILGLSQRQVERFLHSGLIRREPDGRINITEAVRAYYRKKHTATDADYQYEKAMHLRAKRMLLEIKLAKMQNKVIEMDEVELILSGFFVNARTQLTGLPQCLASQLVGLDREEIFRILSLEIFRILTDLSNAEIPVGEEIEKEYERRTGKKYESGAI